MVTLFPSPSRYQGSAKLPWLPDGPPSLTGTRSPRRGLLHIWRKLGFGQSSFSEITYCLAI